MNKKKIPAIVAIAVAVVCLIAAVVLILKPDLFDRKPIKITQKITQEYAYREKGEDWYVFQGKIKNVSNETITIPGKGGLIVGLVNVIGDSDDDWLPGSADIVLAPGEEYDFDNADFVLANHRSVNKVLVRFDGKEYNLLKSNDGVIAIGILLVLGGLIILVFAITGLKAIKNNERIDAGIRSLCAQIGGETAVFDGIFSNKNEERKAAAKNAVWAAGAVLSTMFLGGGVFSVNSASKRAKFILAGDALYAQNVSNPNAVGEVIRLTKNEFTAINIKTKKNNVTMTEADGKTYMTFFTKKSPLTAEELTQRLTDIFVNGKVAETVASEVAANDGDVFEEFAGEKSAESAGAAAEPVESADAATESKPVDGETGAVEKPDGDNE